ncbi:MAG: TatD family deoxyribonuclease [Alphaproteobacteria bacterium PRO2]|nr:TatD family deoxyribonuclease [Alphaproteobacteria bacterium PRO2]
MWIDSHCHLNHSKIAEIGTPETLVTNARAAGVDGMLTICCRISDEFPEVLATAKKFDNVWCTIGTHPHDAGKPDELAVTRDKLVALAKSDSKIVGIGESGLDYFYKHSSPEDQDKSFRKHIRACIESDLPLVVHARDADEDIIRTIKEEGAGSNLTGVMHCFSSGRAMAEAALELGFYISFSGILTFKSATELQDIARNVPLDRVLVETDAPYLAPVPHRGKTNQPAYVGETGKYLAHLHQINEETIAKNCKNNFFTLFKRANNTA